MEMYLSVADVARVLGVTPQMVRLLARQGTLVPAARTVGGIQLFRQEDAERLAAERERRREAGRSRSADATGAP